MKKFKPIILVLTALVTVTVNPYLSSAKNKLKERAINLAGLIFNAQTLLPVDAANIYDTDGHLIGTTDKNGYYKVAINCEQNGEIHFRLKIVKQGYETFTQNEHWGDLGSNPQDIMYFGLRAVNTKAETISSFGNNNGDLSYGHVLANFTKVSTEKTFNDKLADAKAGNENVLVQVDGEYYIVDVNGWIKVKSTNALITLNNKQTVPANKLNAIVKRKDVKGMTPLDASGEKFAIQTR